ncbi:hypothetical protein RchiOBHm_Chr6g0281301 [Rosa chinensis]|uniref:Uncharacterized protein n=1 Tax=Rosa chinensis TaxID=74649 RepID=A0A2P6PTH2_ROSCH|nr:hypothetical protein RchiOBHm_Chr6g0281301 [Rosa chinensis]
MKNQFADALATLVSMISRRYWYPSRRIGLKSVTRVGLKRNRKGSVYQVYVVDLI